MGVLRSVYRVLSDLVIVQFSKLFHVSVASWNARAC